MVARHYFSPYLPLIGLRTLYAVQLKAYVDLIGNLYVSIGTHSIFLVGSLSELVAQAILESFSSFIGYADRFCMDVSR